MALLTTLLACGGARPPHPRSQTLLLQAESAERRRDYATARALYQRAKEAASTSLDRARVGRQFALTLVFWGEYRAAQRELAAVVRLRPDDAPSWHDLGIVRHRLGDEAGAEQALRRAVTLRPGEPRSRIALAALLARARRWPAALVEYRALLRLRLPARVRAKVAWAIRAIERERHRP